MADMDVNISGFDTAMTNLQTKNIEVVAKADNVTKDEAERIFKEIRQTSPVSSGRYKGNWRIEDPPGDFIFIVNDTPYAQHLVFPNAQFRGSPNADDPGQGILHNVRGIVHNRKGGFLSRIRNAIGGLL